MTSPRGLMSLAIGWFMAAALAVGLATPAAAGPYTEPGIPGNSSLFVAWASEVAELVRGPQDISAANSPLASFGSGSNALGPQPNGNGVVSLGDGGSITLTFGAWRIVNGPGADFAVFENGFLSGGGIFAELAHVEVSSDGVNFFRFPSVSLTPTTTQVGGFGVIDATNVFNLAGKHVAGLGTPFDLDDLVGTPGLDVNAVTHVRIIDVVGSINPAFGTTDSLGNLINEPFTTPFASGGFDLDAVGLINAVPEPAPVMALGLAGLIMGLVGRRWRFRTGGTPVSSAPPALALVAFLACLAGEPLSARASPFTLLNETFADDPIANGRATTNAPARFSYANGALTAAYNSGAPTAVATWGLPVTLNQTTSFEFSVRYLLPTNLTEGGGQIAFGLINTAGPASQQTGTNRDGGPSFTGAEGSSYNIVTVDYFPLPTVFSNRSLGPTVIQSNTGVPTDFYNRFTGFSFGSETILDEGAGEIAALPTGTILRTDLEYNAFTGLLTLRVFDEGTGQFLNINGVGGGGVLNDGDPTTIRGNLAGADFAVDAFALTLWNIFDTPTVANIDFRTITVTAAVPEPQVWAMWGLAIAGLAMIARGRRS